jgi:hypothetical protein
LGEGIRAAGGAGILYDSLHHRGGVNIAAYRPINILNVTQTDHWCLTVEAMHLESSPSYSRQAWDSLAGIA